MPRELIAEFSESYMEKLFYFCLKKTGSAFEAEELTQDIALNILTQLNKGTLPENFPAWVWKIARNRYSTWADRKRRQAESVTGSDIGDYELEDGKTGILDKMIHSEDLSLLRRELAFIASDYRNIVVAYYIDDKSVQEIAVSLSLSEDAVKKRLQRARKLLKEGMTMAREFGVRSYKPEQIAFIMNGKDGKQGQPWSIISHLMYKNIFLAAHKNPMTASELALEIGIALPYMEDELEFLTREELLIKVNDKYETAFPIISKEEQYSVHLSNRSIQKALTDKICTLIDLYMKEDGSKVETSFIGYESAKWALLIKTFDWVTSQNDRYNDTEAPDRPDGGKWTITGYEITDWQEPPFVGQHGWISHNPEEVKNEDIRFGQFKFYYKWHCDKTPIHLTYKEAETLWMVANGKTEECEDAYIKKMLNYGYIKEAENIFIPNVVVFDRNAENTVNAEVTKRLKDITSEIDVILKESPDISRGYVLEQAIKDGWLKDESLIDTAGAFIYK